MASTAPTPLTPDWRPGRAQALTLLILAFALAAGATGGLLLHVTGAPVPPTTTLGSLNAHTAELWVSDIVLLLLSVAGLGLGYLIIRRLFAGGTDWTTPTAVLLAFLIIVGGLVVFLIVSHLATTPGLEALRPGGASGAGNNSTTGPTSPGGGAAANATNGTSSGTGQAPPTVALLGYLIPLVLVLVLLVIPLVAAILARRESRALEPLPDGPVRGPREVARLLSEALAELDRGDTARARETILLAYSALLAMLRESGLRRLEVMTARDVEAHLGSSFAISPAASARLRQLFEEARYSPHDMTPAQALEAKAALVQILSEVNNRPTMIGARTPTVVVEAT